MMKQKILKEITNIQPDIPYDIKTMRKGYVFTFYISDDKDSVIIPPETPVDGTILVPVLLPLESNSGKRVQVSIFGEEGASERAIKETIDKIMFITGLDRNFNDFHSSMTDPVVQKAVRTVGTNYRITSTPATQMLVNAIISQNTSFKQYMRMLDLFAKKYGIPFSLKGRGSTIYHSYPSVNADIDCKGLREIGLGYRDNYVMNALDYIKSGSLPMVNEPADDVIKKLVSLKGVGQYSARCYAIYALRKYEVVFLDSYIKSLLENLYPGEITGKELTIKAFESFARKKWGPFAAIALDYLVIFFEPIFMSLKNKTS